jgi:hypothetical protein
MPEYLFCDRAVGAQGLKQLCGLSIDDVMTLGCQKPKTINAYTPYLIKNGANNALAQNYLGQLSDHQVRRNLSELTLTFGGEATSALVTLYSKHGRDFNTGLLGAATSVYNDRTDSFARAVKEYQNTLLDYRAAVKANSPNQILVKTRAFMAFQKLQDQFGNELKVIVGENNSRRGTVLTNSTRATNIAKDSRNASKLFVANQAQAHDLIKFSRYAKVLGNGLAVIDFGSRVGNIHNTHQAGGNWEREMFVESMSFALSTATGTALVKVGSAAVGFLVAATPVGWVGLIVGGTIVVGTAAVGAMTMNNSIKARSGGWYDNIMDWLK